MRHANGISKLEQEGVSVSELKSLQKWYVSQADVEMVMFNIGDVHDVNADQTTAFTTISGTSLMHSVDIIRLTLPLLSILRRLLTTTVSSSSSRNM